MAEGGAHFSKLQHGKVKRYFRDKLEANTRLVDSLRRKQLINDDERDKILQGNLDISIGNTEQHHDTHLVTLYPSNEGSTNQIIETTVNEWNALIEESNIVLYDMQFGCIHLFLHSKKPFYQELCEENNCLVYIEKCLSLKNVEATLKPNQTIKIVITKDAYSLPLKDGKGKSLEFSKKQVIKINRYYINSEINPCTQILARLETITGRLEHSQNKLADILLVLMEEDPEKVWKTLIFSLRELNIVAIADRLEKMTCAGEVLLSFADALSSRSNVVLNFSPCEAHGGEIMDTSACEPDKEFTFLVCKDEKEYANASMNTTLTDDVNMADNMERTSLITDGGEDGMNGQEMKTYAQFS
ncbi:Hypothetical predicted protein [Mytilus galloprovincialis]|uniref:Uncharacterized protein n=1 Tax=Mytilus galloprovincialis TaxID=29158 RepID=A0A8B6BS67_MYTGA|nr:Hypothetical predicted protein [Mytilus galloprovincialis]